MRDLVARPGIRTGPAPVLRPDTHPLYRSTDRANASIYDCIWTTTYYDDVGYFQPDFPASYQITLTDADRRTVYDWAWELFVGAPGSLSNSDIFSMVDVWEAPKDPGLFLNDGWGPAYRVYRHAIQMLDRFRDYIPNDGADCPSARDKVSKGLDKQKYRFRMQLTDGCLPVATPLLAYARARGYADSNGVLAKWDSGDLGTGAKMYQGGSGLTGTKHIGVCTYFACAAGCAWDAHMYESARRYFYVNSGRETDVIRKLRDASESLILGKFALFVVLEYAGFLLHEILHWHFGGSHCNNNCCQARLALKWSCRTMSDLGLLYAGDSGEPADMTCTNSTPKMPNDDTACADDERTGSDAAFHGGCTFSQLGRTGDPDAWSTNVGSSSYASGSWDNPKGCS